MPGLINHLWITLKLNFRSKQAIIYGYVVPIFFLLAFGSVFRSSKPPLLHEMGQLLVVTVLGGACFGMPTAMVNERERGVWRRYRLLPTAIGGIIMSAMVGRFVIVASAGLLQVFLAWKFYGTTLPAHPVGLFIAFGFVTFAFLGLGLIIAMIADTVPAVQALGQAIFLPMIMIGGVGVPLYLLPAWAQHVAGFMPGKYSVEALQACYTGPGIVAARFSMLSLTIIGVAACVAGAKLFRWDIGQKIAGPARAWVAVALVAWAAVGFAAEKTGKQTLAGSPNKAPESSGLLYTIAKGQAGGSTTPPTVQGTTTQPATPATTQAASTQPHVPKSWQEVTLEDMNAITYDDVPDDGGAVTPIAASLEIDDADNKQRLEELGTQLIDWKFAQTPDIAQRVRYLMCVAAIPDVSQDSLESYVPLVVFKRLQADIQRDELMKALTWIVLHPDGGSVITTMKELGFEADIPEEGVRERSYLYSKKLLFRMLGKKIAE